MLENSGNRYLKHKRFFNTPSLLWDDNSILLWFDQQCIRAATSHSRRDSSFQEDLQKARGEFVNAPARFAKLVSLAGDEKENKTMQDSDSEAIKSSDSPEDINP